MGKRWLAAALILVLLLSLAPAGAFASEEEYVFWEDDAGAYTDTQWVTDDAGADGAAYTQDDAQNELYTDASDVWEADPDASGAAQGDAPSDQAGGEAGEDGSLLPEENDTVEGDAVAVHFSCPQAPALGGLSVWDSAGNPMCPDAEDAALYLLRPGLYTCRYHDGDGLYKDYESVFELFAGQEAQLFELSLEPVSYDDLFSLVYVNPLYADVETEETIAAAAEEVSADFGFYSEQTFAFRSEVATPYETIEAAAAEIRRQICLYEPSVTVYLYHELDENMNVNIATWKELCAQINDLAIAHTGRPKEGDYIQYEYGGYKASGGIDSAKGAFYFIYTPKYYSNGEQERELDGIVESILEQLDLEGKSPYNKICAIYDYICSTVIYDNANLENDDYKLKYTAYAALHDHSAICQGFSVAFYRLCLESGVDARVISSLAMEHAWNIVQLGDVYYELDATFDKQETPLQYGFFLMGSTYWINSHKLNGISTLGDQFDDAAFAALYPLSVNDYVHPFATISTVSLLHAPTLRLLFKLQLPAALTADPDAVIACYHGDELFFSAPLSEGVASGNLTLFYVPMTLDGLSDNVTMKLLWGDGFPVRMIRSNKYCASFSLVPSDILKQLSSNPAARALLDFSFAAQNYFRGAELTLSENVPVVTAADLHAYTASTEGLKPRGCARASVSAVFGSAVSLRVYFQLAGRDVSDFSFTLDGVSVTPETCEGGCFVSVPAMPVGDYDTAHSFCISDAYDSFTVTASAMSYAESAVSRGQAAVQDLGRAMHLYHQEAG